MQLVEVSQGSVSPLQQLLSVAGASASLPPVLQVSSEALPSSRLHEHIPICTANTRMSCTP